VAAWRSLRIEDLPTRPEKMEKDKTKKGKIGKKIGKG
jgi:hypothetical protein